jgi:hypothetical protein
MKEYVRMPTSRLQPHACLAIVAGVAAAATVSVAIAADGDGTVRIRPGQWDTTSQIWIDGKHVLRGPESASDRAMREAHARAMVSGDGAYTLAIEGRAHAVDTASGRPLESRMVDTRVVGDGVWRAESCTAGNAAAENGAEMPGSGAERLAGGS